MPQVEIREAAGAQDMATLRRLLTDYGRHLADDPSHTAGICIQDYDAELRSLPGPYTLLLAEVDGTAAGCVALKPIVHAGESACEMKRLWVDRAFRGLGLGRKLVLAALDYATEAGYPALYLDTAPAAMPEASRLYASLGFESTERYNDNPVPGVAFFRRRLERAARWTGC